MHGVTPSQTDRQTDGVIVGHAHTCGTHKQCIDRTHCCRQELNSKQFGLSDTEASRRVHLRHKCSLVVPVMEECKSITVAGATRRGTGPRHAVTDVICLKQSFIGTLVGLSSPESSAFGSVISSRWSLNSQHGY